MGEIILKMESIYNKMVIINPDEYKLNGKKTDCSNERMKELETYAILYENTDR